MTNTNNKNTAPAHVLDRAEIYWDDQDRNNAGWWLRYYVDGAEDGCEIDGDQDDATEVLAARVAEALSSHDEVTVKLSRDPSRPGQIVVDGGAVVRWRAS